MCSFLFTNLLDIDIDFINRILKRRGPDATNYKIINEFLFLHNLLSLCGDFTIQPFLKDGVVCLFNGEIYNYKSFGDYKSDGEIIIDMYLKYGYFFPRFFNGEYTFIIVDLNNSEIILYSDTFATKPLFYSLEDGKVGISSYKSVLKELGLKKIERLDPNTFLVIDSKELNIKNRSSIYSFDLKQYKKTFDDFNVAFERSIKNRVDGVKSKIQVCLSSGYDSGAICAGLNNLGIEYKTFTIDGCENREILEKRLKINNREYSTYEGNDIDINLHSQILKELDQDYIIKWNNKNERLYNFVEDRASLALSHIYTISSSEGYKVVLSSQGADEIFGDYGFNGKKLVFHSCFGGKYPSKLEEIFPKNPNDNEAIWDNFYSGTQKCFMSKEEFVGGNYGIETRYPFLDRDLVQEFLWLDVSLKNSSYKSAIESYLKKNNYPYDKNVKLGFVF